jgi:hypothetical protein
MAQTITVYGIVILPPPPSNIVSKYGLLMTSAFSTFLTTNPPMLFTSAANFKITTNQILDSVGAYTAICSTNVTSGYASGNGATVAIPYIIGATTDSVTWSPGSIPPIFTICSLTRYTNSSSGIGRILQGNGYNFLHGHWGASGPPIPHRGVAYYNSWVTQSSSSIGTTTDWLNMCGKIGGTTPNNVLVDNIALGTATATAQSVAQLAINAGNYPAETSNFAFSLVIIWNSTLTDADMATVSTAIQNYKSTGILG